MKKQKITLATLVLCGGLFAQTKPATTPAKPPVAKPATTSTQKFSTKLDSVSYIVGQSIGANIVKEFSEANVEAVLAGLRDVLKGNPPAIMDPSGQTVNGYFQDRNMKKLEQEHALNKQEGIDFLEKNKKRPEIKVTPSGLQYEVITMGTGEKPSSTSRVKVHYHGTTPDGRVFDSSVERGQPITFGLDQVIKGWTEGLQLMPVGSKFKLYIPQELAYGANPNPASIIEPFMPLVFEVELIEIEK